MSKRKVTLAINNITNCLNQLKKNNPAVFDKTLRTLGVNKIVFERCYSLELYRLSNIYDCLDILDELYDYDGDKLITLARNIRKVFQKYNVVQPVSKSKGKTKPKKNTAKKNKTVLASERLLKKIDARASGECCLCATFNELSKIAQKDFISLMRKRYPNICGYKLSKEKVKSWRDEYDQIVKTFIPVLRKHDRSILNFHIVFELRLPKFRTDLDADEYVYSDAVIVGDDGFVVLEFKQRDTSDSKAIDYFCSQALKYIKRLRFHKIGRRQSYRYTYLICTKENENKVWIYDDKEDFWFGNPKGVAEDICTEFFDNVNPNDDIEEWLTAGFREKRAK